MGSCGLAAGASVSQRGCGRRINDPVLEHGNKKDATGKEKPNPAVMVPVLLHAAENLNVKMTGRSLRSRVVSACRYQLVPLY